MTGRVRFLPNRDREELPQVMSALDVLLLPSRTTSRWKEQFGRVIIEAHACGTPVIGSDSGAIPGVVGNGGLIVPEQNPSALAAAICKIRASPALRDQMAAAGRRQTEQHYSWQQVAALMRKIYLSIPQRGPADSLRFGVKEPAR
jgi:glycosyltransferase involved in cell wall biosynthesis